MMSREDLPRRLERAGARYLQEALKRTRKLSLRVPVIPALFSTLRILAVAPLLYLLSSGKGPVAVFWLALFAALTDYLDGWIARRMRCKTYGGKILDFAADKVFLIVVLLAQAAAGQLEAVVSGIVAGYHLLIILVLTVVSWGVSTPVVPLPTGEKLVVILSYLLVVTVAGRAAFPGKAIYSTLGGVCGILAVLSVLVGLWSYLRLTKRILGKFE